MFDNNKWVEKYTLRYAVGTIFGAAIISFETGIVNSNNGFSFEHLWEMAPFLFAAGFAFSFVASCPLYVLYIARGLRLANISQRGLIFLVFIILTFGVSRKILTNFLDEFFISFTGILLILFAVLYFTIILTSLISLFFIRQNTSYFLRLSEARSESGANTQSRVEFIESYREIRENGNAFGIIVMQVVLYLGFCSISCFTEAANNTQCIYIVPFSMIGLLVFPGWLGMYLGTNLEKNMVDNQYTKMNKTDSFFKRRIKLIFRAPLLYFRKLRNRIFGTEKEWAAKSRDEFPLGSWQWLALTESIYSGFKVGTASGLNRGGDRMSPFFHGYGEAYEKFLKPFLSRCEERLTLVEIGILNGSGLAIWCDLFPNARVIGLDIDLSNFKANRASLEAAGAFAANQPELHEFNQLDFLKATRVLADILGDKKVDIAIDDGCHSIESIEITLRAMVPYMATDCVYFIEDNFDSFDVLARRYKQWHWSQRGEMTIATGR